ncbi:MAG: HIT domain-containing protein [Candidatus Daviesbacteria bacterium]|nr:HIT domain-containing protein [Candidatus Daviesbacteria bacterium]
MDDCIFCKIIRKEIPKEFSFESDTLVAFPDISPSADVHILVIPKEHIGSVEDIKSEHGALLSEIYQTVNKLVADNNLRNNAYRVVVNGGKAQHVPHLHFHLLGGQWKKFV